MVREMLGTPDLIQQVQAESAEARRVAQRQEAASTLRRETEALEREVPGLVATVEKARAKEAAAWRAYQAALAERQRAAASKASAVGRHESVVRKAEAELRASCSSQIRAAERRIGEQGEKDRQTLRPRVEGDWLDCYSRPGGNLRSTSAAIRRRCEWSGEALAALDRLALEPLTEAEVTARIASIEASIPDPDVFEPIGQASGAAPSVSPAHSPAASPWVTEGATQA